MPNTIFKPILLLFFSLCFHALKAQSTINYAQVWVNTSYKACIDTTLAICKCDQSNPFLLIEFDTTSQKLNVQTAINKNWEGFEFSLIQAGNNTYNYLHYDTDSIINTVLITDTLMILTHNKISYEFKPMMVMVKTEDEGLDLDKILGRMNAQSIMKAKFFDCSSDTILPLITEYYHQLVDEGNLYAYCPDDGYYESYIDKKNDKVMYYLIKGIYTALCLSDRDRSRREFIKNEDLTPCYTIKWD